MTTYESPLGKKRIASQPMREFSVPDESGYEEQINQPAPRTRHHLPNIDERAMANFQSSLPSEQELAVVEREMQEARQIKKAGRERLSEGAKRRIDMLLGMTRGVRECTIGDTTFVLQTLKGKEMREAIMFASAFDGTVQSPFEIRKQLLARSLSHVGGIEIEQFIGSNNFEDKLLFVEEIDDVLSNRLYDEYLILAKESKDKYAIKTEAEIKEVIADLKK